MTQTQHPKNQSGQSQERDLVKPGTTIDPKGGPTPNQGYGGQQAQGGQQQGQGGKQQAVWPSQAQQTDQDRQQMQEHQQKAWDEAGRREKDNNPATREQRQYDKNAPGMDPANQPAPDTKYNKATRLDLEDITGNPGHRGVNPDAPAGSINRAPDDKTGHVESINEPSHINQNWPKRGQQQGMPGQQDAAPVVQSINEPPGSQVIPPGAGAGTGEERPGTNPPDGSGAPAPVITSVEPESAEIGGGNTTFGLIVTGSGFDDACVIVFDDEEQETIHVSATELRATPDMPTEAGEVDVEVERDGVSSEVLTIDFTAPGASRSERKREPTRKPKKPTPAAKRDKSGKKKR